MKNTNKLILNIAVISSAIFNIMHANSLYLDLMKKCLLNTIYQDPSFLIHQYNESYRQQGRDWPTVAHTMIGLDGLNNIQACLEDVIKNNIPGDCIETGVWRGGSVIFMRAILKENNITDKTVWVADSFEGLPEPDSKKYPHDNYTFKVSETNKVLSISVETVQSNFAKYDLLDNQVKFLKGWFKNTLPYAPIEKLAILRLDGDYYESTMDALDALYPKLSIGGYLIIDDYVAMDACAKAVEDYRRLHNITDPIEEAGWSIRFWKKTK